MKKKGNKHPTYETQLSIGQKAADKVTKFCGSWTFIIVVIALIIAWITLNSLAFILHWDPWPFIILNLVLSCLAALQAPIILMSSNRQTERDRITAKYDYQVNRKAEREISKVLKEVKTIKTYVYENMKMSNPKKLKRNK
jgi:uncharacterized membrane protein